MITITRGEVTWAVSALALWILALAGAIALSVLARQRVRRRAPLVAAARAAVVAIGASAADPPTTADPARWVPGEHGAALSALRGDELTRVLSEFAASLSGDSLLALRVAAGRSGLTARAERRLASRSWTRRLAAARLLTVLRFAIPPGGVALFDDPHSVIRAQMATWAGGTADATMLDRIVGLLSDPDGRCRYAATDALIRIGTPATAALVRLLDGSDQAATSAALRVAAAVGHPSYAAPAARIAATGSPVQRALAARVLSASGDATVAPVLRALLSDPQALVREAATAAVAQLGDWSAAAAVADLLADEAWQVRRAAGLGLLELGAPGLVMLRAAAKAADGAAEVANQALRLHDLRDVPVALGGVR